MLYLMPMHTNTHDVALDVYAHTHTHDVVPDALFYFLFA